MILKKTLTFAVSVLNTLQHFNRRYHSSAIVRLEHDHMKFHLQQRVVTEIIYIVLV